MRSKLQLEPIYLSWYEEAIGILQRVEEIEGGTILTFRNGIRVAVPLPFLASLKKRTGKKIGILRTDLSNKPYLVREVK